MWQLPTKPLLTAGLALLPLAPINAVTESELPGIIEQMGERLRSHRGRKKAEVVWAAAYILLGLAFFCALQGNYFEE